MTYASWKLIAKTLDIQVPYRYTIDMANTNRDPQFTAYIPSDVLEALKIRAKRERRSINAQIVLFIEQGLRTKEARKEMIWNNGTQSYRGTTSGGKIVDVTGGEWTESLHDGIQAYLDNQFPADHDGEEFDGDLEKFLNQYPSVYENYENLTLIELSDPDMWAAQVGENQNVEFIEQ